MKTHISRWLGGSCLILAMSGGALARVIDTAVDAVSVPNAAQVKQRMAGLAVPFEANTGQEDDRVAFTARTLGGMLFVTRAGQLVHSFPGLPVAGQDGASERKAMQKRGPGWVLTESLVNAHPVLRGGTASATRVGRFVGRDPTRWQAAVPTYERVSLGAVWPGIELELAARGNNVEKLFTIAPGTDARRIAIRLGGAQRLELAADGALIAHTGNGPVSFTAPVAWQDIDGERQAVTVAYTLTGSRYGFLLGDYKRAYAVVIDPVVQATYLGGSGTDQANAITLDASGNVLVAGTTASTKFPGTTGGAQAANGGGTDAFVAKLNNGLTALTQATYLGGSGTDQVNAITLDASGNVYVAGVTTSTNFPGTVGGAQAANGGGTDAFVAKLNNGLTTLTQATYLGGNGDEGVNAIALDASGNVFVAGLTSSPNFPGTAGGAQSSGGSFYYEHAFVAELNNGLTTLTQATYLGGSGYDLANAIALDANGNVFVAGETGNKVAEGSQFDNFPGTTGGAQASFGGGGGDGFVAKLTHDLKTLTRATYLGGKGMDAAYAIALDAGGNVFVVGWTWGGFPGTAGGTQASNGGDRDAFVAKLNNGLTTLTQATYLGGSGDDRANAIVLDKSGNVFVAGSTNSSDFPSTTGWGQASFGGIGDVFVAKLNPGLTKLTQATYLGGSGDDQAKAIALDASGNVFVAGLTGSTNFPGTAGGVQAAYGGGGSDAFVAKLTSDWVGRISIKWPIFRPIIPWYEWPQLLLILGAAGVLLAVVGVVVVRRRRNRKTAS